MEGEINLGTSGTDFSHTQACVIAVRNSQIDSRLKVEAEKFIRRNLITDCGRVSPNCLKAHLIKNAIKLILTEEEINELIYLFESDIGYKGYYLDAGRLRRI